MEMRFLQALNQAKGYLSHFPNGLLLTNMIESFEKENEGI